MDAVRALAAALRLPVPLSGLEADASGEVAEALVSRLREQGYVLVSQEGLARALAQADAATAPHLFCPDHLLLYRDAAAAILSALAPERQP